MLNAAAKKMDFSQAPVEEGAAGQGPWKSQNEIQDALVYQAAEQIISRYQPSLKDSSPFMIEAFDVPHRALIEISEKLDVLGTGRILKSRLLSALKDYVVLNGGNFSRATGATPVRLAICVADKKPDAKFKEGVTEVAAIDGRGAMVEGVSNIAVRMTINGTSMTSNVADVDKIFSSVRGSKLWIVFESPSQNELEGWMNDQQVAMTAMVEAMGGQAGAEDIKKAVQDFAEKGGTMSPALEEITAGIIEAKQLLQKPADAEQKARLQVLVAHINELITQNLNNPTVPPVVFTSGLSIVQKAVESMAAPVVNMALGQGLTQAVSALEVVAANKNDVAIKGQDVVAPIEVAVVPAMDTPVSEVAVLPPSQNLGGVSEQGMVEHFAPEKISAVSGAVVTEVAVNMAQEQTSQAQVPVHAKTEVQPQETVVARDAVVLSTVESPVSVETVDKAALEAYAADASKINSDKNIILEPAVITPDVKSEISASAIEVTASMPIEKAAVMEIQKETASIPARNADVIAVPDIKTSLQIETFRDVATSPLITPIVMESVKPDMVAPTTPSATPEKRSIKPVSIDVVMPSAPKFIPTPTPTPTPAPIPERGVVPTPEKRLEPKIHTVIQRPAAPVVPPPSPVPVLKPAHLQPVDVKPPALPHPAPKPYTVPTQVVPTDVRVDVPPTKPMVQQEEGNTPTRGPNPTLPPTSKPDEPVTPQRPPEFDRKEVPRPDDNHITPVEGAPRKPDDNRYDPVPEPMPKPAPVHDDRKWDLPTPVVHVVPVVPDTPINIYTQPDITPKIPDDIGGGGGGEGIKPEKTGCGPTCGACGKCFNETALGNAVKEAEKFGEEYRLRNASKPGNDFR